MLDRDLLVTVATAHQLDPLLVEALVGIESSDDPDAWNPEPTYPYLWDVKLGRPFRSLAWSETIAPFPPQDFFDVRGWRGKDADQEWWGQKASWGLMQVMGAVARERGFTGTYLGSLLKPAVNLPIGCAHLRSHLTWAGGSEHRALAAYNAGRGGVESQQGRNYAQKVLSHYARLRGGHA